jgi:hypothetical protein
MKEPEDSPTEPPHDILAADEFEIGTRDERFPADPSGIQEPHDVLAAEEFAMPTPEPIDDSSPGIGARVKDPRTLLPLLLIIAFVAILLRRRG